MCMKTYASPDGLRLTSSTTTEEFYPFTAWMPIARPSAWRFNVMLAGKTGNFRVRPGYQLAAVRPTVAGTPGFVGSYITTEGWTPVSGVSLPGVSNVFWWRLGAMASSSSGVGSGDVKIEAQIRSNGDFLGQERILLQPYNEKDGATPMVFPVSSWVPSIALDKVMAAIVVEQNTAGLNAYKHRLMVRWADDKQAPFTDWLDLEAGWINIAPGNSDRNTTAVGVGTIQASYAQFGLGIYKASGNAGRAIVHVATSIGRV